METEFMTKLTEASRAGSDLQGTFDGEVDLVYVSLQASEDVTSTLDGEFTTRELAAIVAYKESKL